MKTQDIVGWLEYWNAAGMVAVPKILAFEHVAQARKYCECMRVGRFSSVTDLQIWRAILEMRK